MDNIDKRIELLHKVQEEMDRRGKIQEEADRLHMAGDFKKEGELYAALRDDSILQNLFRQLDELNEEEEVDEAYERNKKLDNAEAAVEKDIVKKSIEHWGSQKQSIIAMEECAELTQAISKIMLQGKGESYHLAEAIADTYISLEILKQVYEIDERDLQKIVRKKQVRIMNRIMNRIMEGEGKDEHEVCDAFGRH